VNVLPLLHAQALFFKPTEKKLGFLKRTKPRRRRAETAIEMRGHNEGNLDPDHRECISIDGEINLSPKNPRDESDLLLVELQQAAARPPTKSQPMAVEWEPYICHMGDRSTQKGVSASDKKRNGKTVTAGKGAVAPSGKKVTKGI